MVENYKKYKMVENYKRASNGSVVAGHWAHLGDRGASKVKPAGCLECTLTYSWVELAAATRLDLYHNCCTYHQVMGWDGVTQAPASANGADY